MSRATLIDERPEDEGTTEAFQEPTVENPVEQEEPQEEQAVESPIPEKYQGKSVEELVQMHQELEKFSGKQSTEVGELRKVVDDFIQNQTQLDTQAPVPQQFDDPQEEVDFFVDPSTAVNRAIDNHPKIKQAEAYSAEYKKQTALAQLKQNHPDMDTILHDTKFAEWIKASKVRTQLFVQADQMYDYDAANELFSLWKERNQAVQQTVKAETQARKNSVKSARTGGARGSAEGARRKTYRRADIIKLMQTDPDRYMTLQPEIMAAYAEGRVK